MTGVIYARYSSNLQREESIEQQIEECKAYAKANDINIVKIYADKAVSGKTDKRDAFQRLKKDIPKGLFECVIAYKSSRIARNTYHALEFEELLSRNGIQMFYAREDFGNNAAGRLALRMMMSINQFYSENLSEDVKRGMRGDAEQGLAINAPPYGYKIVDKHYAIEPAQAEVVKEIFDAVLKGITFAELAESLNSRGLRTRRGGKFGKSSFAHILTNERYRGVYEYMDVRIEDGMPRIIDEETFFKVQEALKTKPNPRGHRHAGDNSEYLLTGKLFCGLCGSPMSGMCGTSKSGVKYYYYSCQGRPECKKENVKREVIEQAVTQYTVDLVLTDDVIEKLADAAMQYQEDAIKNSPLPALESELRENKKALQNCLKAIEQGILSDTVVNRVNELELECQELQSQIALARADRPHFTREQFIFTLEKFRGGDASDKRYQRLIIKSFVEKVVLFDGRIEIHYLSDNGVRVKSEPGHQLRVSRTQESELLSYGLAFVLSIALESEKLL